MSKIKSWLNKYDDYGGIRNWEVITVLTFHLVFWPIVFYLCV